jgi:hypothetical protein
MPGARQRSARLIAAAVSLAPTVSTIAIAEAEDAARIIGNNESIFIDAKSFNVIQGTSKTDVAAQIKNLGARELGPGAIIFRSGEKLYIVDVQPTDRATHDPFDRQRPPGPRYADVQRQQPQGLPDLAYLNDPDYASFRLQKAFDEIWTTTDKK